MQGMADSAWYLSLFPNAPASSVLWPKLEESVYERMGEHKLFPALSGDAVIMVPRACALVSPNTLPQEVQNFIIHSRASTLTFCQISEPIAQKIPGLHFFKPEICRDLLRDYGTLTQYPYLSAYYPNFLIAAGQSRISYGQPGKNQQVLLNTEDEVLALLDYCVLNGSEEFHKDLVGLPLIPLASGEIGVLGTTDFYIHDRIEILPHATNLFLSQSAKECMY